MKSYQIIALVLALGTIQVLAKRSPHYVPSPKEVLTRAEYKDIYSSGSGNSLSSLNKRMSKLQTLLKNTQDPFKRKGIDQGIRETSMKIWDRQ